MLLEVRQTTESVATIERFNLFDLFRAEGEVKDVQVRLNPFRGDGFRYHHNAAINLEAEQDRRGALSVFSTHLFEDGVSKEWRFIRGRPVIVTHRAQCEM